MAERVLLAMTGLFLLGVLALVMLALRIIKPTNERQP